MLLLVTLSAACSSSGADSTLPTTSDTPRYTQEQVWKAANGQGFRCGKTSWHYTGNGLWECGSNRIFDERTGIAGGFKAQPTPTIRGR